MPKVDADPATLSEVVARARQQVDESLTIGVGDTQAEIADDLRESILVMLEVLTRGVDLDITVLPRELTTGQAADLLGISRPTVVKLIDRGDLPATRVGTRRRLATMDVLAYRQRSRSDRAATVEDIISVSQELDLY